MTAVGLTAQQLEEYAWHVCWEIEQLLDQAPLLVERYGPAGPQGSDTDPEGEALLEAVLVHLRLLDDFLDTRRKNPADIHASDWVSGWAGRAFLSRGERRAINRQVAHLSSHRDVWAGWDVPSYVGRCCDSLIQFFSEITDAHRHDDFVGTRERVSTERPNFP